MKWQLMLTMAMATVPAAAGAQQDQRPPSPSQPTYGQQGQAAADTNYTDTSATTTKRDSSMGAVAPDPTLKDTTVKDSTKNQTQSGMVDSAGASTLGPKVKKVKPTQGTPVTSKGDTLKKGGDTTSGGVAHPRYDSAGTARDTTRPPR